MDIGIGIPNTIPGVEGAQLLDWARAAEERGFASLATIGRVAFPGYEELITLAAAGAVTSRIGLFTDVLLAPTRSPVMLAKQAASVAQLSGGRLTLGLAVGLRRDDYEAVGRRYARRGDALDEALPLLRRAWEGEPVAGSPEAVGPRPPGGRIPILVGGMSDPALRRTIEFGDGWTAGGAPADRVAEFVERLRASWSEAGREGEPHIRALTYFSMGEATQASIEYLHRYYGYTGEYAERVALGAARGGDEVRERVHRYSEVGVDQLVFMPTVAEVSQVYLLAQAVL